MQRIVGCFLEYDGKFVILRRRADKPNGNTWGLPAGKVEPGETDAQAMLRELYEETGYQADTQELEHLGDFPFDLPTQKLVFVSYRIQLNRQPVIRLEHNAHTASAWIAPEACFQKKDLIAGIQDLLRFVGYV
ncbi:MAG TPA: NUDIX hydrolase [Candidatus Saccharimonadales bacterium]|nr:NUDIX hydrolase [Candidatus Saccharimonadales bacterium]